MRDSSTEARDRVLLTPLIAFSERMHQAAGDRHHVASPLGAWMLLAIAATATEGREREACAAALGMSVDKAATVASRLLGAPHPAAACVAAVWTNGQFDTPALQAWRTKLPESAVRGAMPTQAEADRWARRSTSGMASRFPGTIEPFTALVLATALAAETKWIAPYEVIAGTSLARPGTGGEGSWASQVRWALGSSFFNSHQRIMHSARAGDLAVHGMRAQSGLEVTSVIARTGVPPREVLAAALRIATGATGDGELHAVSLFDLPLGDDELWSIEEKRTREPLGYEILDSYLPAWEAGGEHDLLAMPLEIDTAAWAIQAMLNAPSAPPPRAQQVAGVRYHRAGFKAWAISALETCGHAPDFPTRPMRRGAMRHATLRFGHPYAVVAVVGESVSYTRSADVGIPGSVWTGLPVFSAWVAEPSEAEREARKG